MSTLDPPNPQLPRLPNRIHLQADYFAGQVDTRAFLAGNPDLAVLSRTPLVLAEEDSVFFITRFGVVVSWNAPRARLEAFHDRLLAWPGIGPRVESFADRLTVYADAPQDQAGFNEVWLHGLSLAKAGAVSLALAKSVALDQFETEVSAAMAKTAPLLADLRSAGRVRMKHTEVLKIIGFAMEVEAAVLNNLTLFEDPPEAWESEELDRLHRALSEQFDLPRRGEAINRKLAYLSDTGQVLTDLLSTRKAHQLEWIVIVLIAIETVFFVAREVVPH